MNQQAVSETTDKEKHMSREAKKIEKLLSEGYTVAQLKREVRQVRNVLGGKGSLAQEADRWEAVLEQRAQ